MLVPKENAVFRCVESVHCGVVDFFTLFVFVVGCAVSDAEETKVDERDILRCSEGFNCCITRGDLCIQIVVCVQVCTSVCFVKDIPMFTGEGSPVAVPHFAIFNLCKDFFCGVVGEDEGVVTVYGVKVCSK